MNNIPMPTVSDGELRIPLSLIRTVTEHHYLGGPPYLVTIEGAFGRGELSIPDDGTIAKAINQFFRDKRAPGGLPA